MNKTEFDAFNDSIITQFRANAGTVDGPFGDLSVLLLHTKGRRSGQDRLSPVAYLRDGDRYVVIASKGGAPTHPDWYYNLMSAPTARIEVGTEEFDVTVTEVKGAERDRLYARAAEATPSFADYQAGTTRVIPVVALTRV